MGRQTRYTKPGGELKAISNRCFQQRHLLRPSPTVNQIVAGILARAQHRTGVEVVGVTVLSNHMHQLVWGQDSRQIAEYMHYCDGNIAREVGRLHGWSGKFWEKRYQSSSVTDEEAIQVALLRYLLEQGCKEGLVERPEDWPGIHASSSILGERTLEGIWIDRTGFCLANRLKSNKARLADFHEIETLKLAKLPCWKHLSDEEYATRVRELIEDIEQETRQRHRSEGTQPLGKRAVLKVNPKSRPKESKKSPLPLVRAATKKARDEFLEGLRWFLAAYREASARLRAGESPVSFPEGCFPPAQSFIESSIQPRAG
jgi:REP element-mobilizing transposase RayT